MRGLIRVGCVVMVLAGLGAQAAPQGGQAEKFQNLRSMLGALRSLLALYQMQHNPRNPTLANLSDWHSLLESTYDDGHFGPNGANGASLKAAPVNPLTGNSTVVAAGSAGAEAGWTFDVRTGVLKAIVPAADAAEAGKWLLPGDFEVAR